MRGGGGLKLCLYQPARHCRRPQAPTNSEHPKKPQTQPRDNKLEAEGPIASCSSGGMGSVGERWGSGGPYQQQVLHLVLGFVARRGHVLKRKGKGTA